MVGTMIRQVIRRCALVAGLLFVVAAARAQTEYDSLRQPALSRLAAHLQADQLDAARRELADYLARRPGDAVMQYNLACLFALASEPDSALARLDAAFAAGYRDLDRALTDPDLVRLAGDPRLAALIDGVRAGRVSRMRDAGQALTEGVWSDMAPLRPDPFVPGPKAPVKDVRFRYDRDGLACEIRGPLRGEEEVVVVVALPRDLDHEETDRWFEFRTPVVDAGPVPRTGRNGRAETVAAAASIERCDREVALVTIPWTSLHPHRPPIELLLGLNVIVRLPDPDGPAARWSLVPDPSAASSDQPWRRFAPLSLDPGPAPAPLLAGRLDTYLVVGDSLSAELGIQGCPGGEARCTLTAGSPGRESARDTTFTVLLEPDLAYLTVDLDLTGLEPGWFEVGAEIALGDHRPLAWCDRGFRLSPDWFLRERERAAALPAAERSIVDYQLFRTLRGQQQFRPHDDPADIAAASLATTALLDRAAATGSVLPAEPCHVDAAFPSGPDALQACRLVLPPAELRGQGTVVVVLAPDQAATMALAEALAAQRTADEPRSFVTVTAAQVAGQPATAAGVATAVRAWLVALLSPRTLQLVGTGAAAAVARYESARAPGDWTCVLALAEVEPVARWSARILASTSPAVAPAPARQ